MYYSILHQFFVHSVLRNVTLVTIELCGHSCKDVSNWHLFQLKPKNLGTSSFFNSRDLSVISSLAPALFGVSMAPLLPLASLRVVSSSYLAKQYSSTWTLLLCMYAHVWHE